MTQILFLTMGISCILFVKYHPLLNYHTGLKSIHFPKLETDPLYDIHAEKICCEKIKIKIKN